MKISDEQVKRLVWKSGDVEFLKQKEKVSKEEHQEEDEYEEDQDTSDADT